MVTKEAKEIIQNAIKNPEFIKGIAESIDFFDTIVKAYKTENIIVLQSVRNALDRRITELNIKFWFIRIGLVENNILNELLN